MTANEDLITWNTRWRLYGGAVSCRTCQASQAETDRGKQFEHVPGCGYAGQLRDPWTDLDAIAESFKRDR